MLPPTLVQKYNIFGEIVQITAVFFSKQTIIQAFCGYELENSSQSCKFVVIYLYMNEEHSLKKACEGHHKDGKCRKTDSFALPFSWMSLAQQRRKAEMRCNHKDKPQ